MVLGLLEIQDNEEVCQGCAVGKYHREPCFKETTWRTEEPLDLVHSDVCGPMQVPIMSGNMYFLTIIGDYLRMC